MLLHYVHLRENDLNPNKEEIYGLLLSPTVDRKVDVLIKKLEDLDEVTKKLQRPDASIYSPCDNYSFALINFLGLPNRPDPDAQV